jgi:hypothetical protein
MPRRVAGQNGGANGAGYGGPAKGAGQHGPGPRPGRPTADVAAVIAAAKEARIEAMKAHLIGLALTAEREETQVTATLGYLKHEAPPASKLEVTGADGAPMAIEWRVVNAGDRDA